VTLKTDKYSGLEVRVIGFTSGYADVTLTWK